MPGPFGPKVMLVAPQYAIFLGEKQRVTSPVETAGGILGMQDVITRTGIWPVHSD